MIAVRQIHHSFFGEVTGIDLAKPCDDLAIAEIQRAIDACAVLVFRNQQALGVNGQIELSAQFGPVTRSITVHRVDTERRLWRDELSDISNIAEDGKRLAPDDRKRQTHARCGCGIPTVRCANRSGAGKGSTE